MKKIVIFIDESGTLPDPKDKVVIVAAVGTSNPLILEKVIKATRKNLKKRNKTITEIKFYHAGEKTKNKFLEELRKQKIDIFTLCVEKYGLKIVDSPQNFALICWLLIEDCLIFYQNEVSQIIFDRHFNKPNDQKKFNQILINLLGKNFKVFHVDSLEDPRVNVSDMVAGSTLWAKTGKDSKFYDLIKNKIISEKILNWKEVKRKFLEKKSR